MNIVISLTSFRICMSAMKSCQKEAVRPRSAILGRLMNVDETIYLPIFSQIYQFQGQTFRMQTMLVAWSCVLPNNLAL